MFSKRWMTIALFAVVGCSSPEEENNHAHDNHDHENNHAHADAANNHEHGDMGHAHEGDADHHGPVDLAGIDFGADVTISAAAEDYCECMLISCHDPFHEKYGADDAEAIAACQLDASSWPVAGSEQMSGDSIECRQYHCDNAATSSCDDALGAACM